MEWFESNVISKETETRNSYYKYKREFESNVISKETETIEYVSPSVDMFESNVISKEVITMKFEELFEQRSLVASKLNDCIRDRGYTKVSFSSKVDVSRATLDQLLKGSIDNKSTFDRHLQKILAELNLSAEELLCYHKSPLNADATAIFYRMHR